MEKGTFTSKKDLKEGLCQVAALIKRNYGVSVWFVEILGKRWSYLAGEEEMISPLSSNERVKIDERFGLIADRWKEIPEKDRRKIIASVKRIIRENYA